MNLASVVVLGAGGTAAVPYHLGILDGLAEVGVLDRNALVRVIGTSAGAQVAAALAGGVSAYAYLQLLSAAAPDGLVREVARGLRRRDGEHHAMDAPAWTEVDEIAESYGRGHGLLTRALGRAGWLRFDGMSTTMPWRDGTWCNKLWLTAVRVRDGRTVVFGRDLTGVRLSSAVEASSAVPGLVRPRRIGEEYYLDGALNSPTHARLALLQDKPGLTVVSAPMNAGRGPTAAFARRRLSDELRDVRRRQPVLVLTPGDRAAAAMRGYPYRDREARWQIYDAALEEGRRGVGPR